MTRLSGSSGFSRDSRDAIDGIRPAASRLKPLLQVLFVAMMMFAGIAGAQAIDPLPFKSHAEEVRFQQLAGQLRCLVCQNESLADSNAGLARDLRHEVFGLMQQGKSDQQIKQYLVDRYSDFVLYDPPVKSSTWLLWFGPGLLLLVGAGVVLLTVRKRSRSGVPVAPVDQGEDW